MQELGHALGGATIPVVVIFLSVGFLLTIKFIASRYKKFSPTTAGVFYGRQYKVKIGETETVQGFKVVLVAEATRDREIAVSNAEQQAAKTKAQNAALVAEAERDRDVKIADAKTISETQRAISEKAFAIASAAQDEKRLVAEAQRDAAEKGAQVDVQKKEALRREQELEAIRDVLRPFSCSIRNERVSPHPS